MSRLLTALNRIVVSIRHSLDLEETLKVATKELGGALAASRVSFWKVEGDALCLAAAFPEEAARSLPLPVPSAADGAAGEATGSLPLPVLSTVGVAVGVAAGEVTDYRIQQIVETRRPLVVDDVLAFTAANPDVAATVQTWSAESGVLSEIVFPVFVNEAFWGALSISQTDRPRKWSSGEVALVEAVTAQVEIAVSHSRLFEEARQAARREILIGRIMREINRCSQLDEVFPVLGRELGDYLNVEKLIIAKLNEEAGEWAIVGEYTDQEFSMPGRTYRTSDVDGLSGLMGGTPILCNDVETDPRLGPYLNFLMRPAGTRAFMTVLVRHGDANRLTITAIMKSRPRVWSQEEAEVLSAAADHVLAALQRAELFQQVSRGKREWEATFDALTDGIFIFDRSGTLCRVNEAAASLEGASAADLIGRRCCTLMPSVEAESCRVAQVIESGKPLTFELTPQRLMQPLLVTIAPLANRAPFRNGREEPLGAVCIVRDLSELRAAEASAREQRGFLVKLIEHAHDAIFALSPEGRFIWFNEQLTKLSGYSRHELFASDFRQFLPEGEKRIAIERFTGALAGDAQTFEMRALKKDGEARFLLVTYTPIYDNERLSSVLSIARDITEKKLAAERTAQADKLRALGQLASGVAHNFNNILAAILGHAQLIRRDTKDERLNRRMDVIERAALDGAQTVKRIQGFALQQNETTFNAIDVNALVQDSANLTQARWRDDAQARGLNYQVDLDLRAIPHVPGSASELREVFVNIILNALDAMPQGGRLKISTAANGSLIKVAFRDTGIGMSTSVRERIFEPFFSTKGASGMGLGLAVSYGIIERHGGRIEATSNPGSGSTFTIALPTAKSAAPEQPAARPKNGRSADILVIDDDQPVREALLGMLVSAGHRAEQAASGFEGLAKMESGRFNIVFTDLSMPEMDGWAVASTIRRRWPEVKVVLATGYAVAQEVMESNSDLVNAVIFKPVRFDDITDTLNRVLQ
jgi:PAS domain S-box-containing protein